MVEILKTSFVVDLAAPVNSGWLPAGSAPAREQDSKLAIVRLSIAQDGDAFYLFSSSEHPDFHCGDTFHQSVEDAVAQAEDQFGVSKENWQPVAA